jgi:hypothetical protein
MDVKNYYLNLDKVNKLEAEEKSRIWDIYRDMIYSYEDKRLSISNSLFNTLYYSGYLCDMRNEKISQILDEDNTIGN